MTYKVMLVDDDGAMHEVVGKLLERQGYAFCGALDGESGLSMLALEAPDLLLLDVMLPDVNGFDFCARIRAEGNRVPIIFLSGKTDIVDKTIGFRAGGDDYVTKPFDSVELALRVEANIRRHRSDMEFASKRLGEVVVGDLEIRPEERRVLTSGLPVALTAKEFDIVALLASSPGRVFSREEIQDHLWGAGSVDARGSNTITVFIRKIRSKIEANPSEPEHLITVQGVGYKLV